MFGRSLSLVCLAAGSIATHAQEFPLPVADRKPTFDVAPRFPGGSDAMMRYFADSVRYPEPERSKGKQGLVLASFTVTKKGRVTDVRIVNGVAYAPNLAAEARRLLEAMPRWDPATLNGKRVDAEVDVAVPFRLGPVHR